MATPLGEDGFAEEKALEQLASSLCARVVAGTPLSAENRTSLVKELLALDPDTNFYHDLTAHLTETFVRGADFRERTSYSTVRLTDPDEPVFGALSPEQMTTLLQLLTAVLPLSDVLVDSPLVSRVADWLQVSDVTSEVAAALEELAVAAAGLSRGVCGAVVQAVVAGLPRDPPALLMAALARIVTTHPAAAYEGVAATLSPEDASGDGVVLVARLGCAGALFPAEQTTKLLTTILEQSSSTRDLYRVIKVAIALSIVLPHTLPVGNGLAEHAVRSGVLRLLQWPRAADGSPAATDIPRTPSPEQSARGQSDLTSESESVWVGGLVQQVALSLMQASYWTYPVETLACVRGLSTEDGPEFAVIRGWMIETSLHPKLVDRDIAEEGDSGAAAAFVAAHCAPATGITMAAGGDDGASSGGGGWGVWDNGSGVVRGGKGPGRAAAGLTVPVAEGSAAESAGDRTDTNEGGQPTEEGGSEIAETMQILVEARNRAKARRLARQAQSGPVDAMLIQLRADVASVAPRLSGLAQIHHEVVLARMQIVYLEHVRSQQLKRCRDLERQVLALTIHPPPPLTTSMPTGSTHSRPSSRRTSANASHSPGTRRSRSTDTLLADPGHDEGRSESAVAALEARVQELEAANAQLRQEHAEAEATAQRERETLVNELDAVRKEAAISKQQQKEAMLADAAAERTDLWTKLDEVTNACIEWEGTAGDYLKVTEHCAQLQRYCKSLGLQRRSAVVELRKTREEMAEKEVKLDAALSERVHLKKKCDEIAEALEKQALALEQMQVLSEGKLRAVESKYASQKQINIALQRRILELSATAALVDDSVVMQPPPTEPKPAHQLSDQFHGT